MAAMGRHLVLSLLPSVTILRKAMLTRQAPSALKYQGRRRHGDGRWWEAETPGAWWLIMKSSKLIRLWRYRLTSGASMQLPGAWPGEARRCVYMMKMAIAC